MGLTVSFEVILFLKYVLKIAAEALLLGELFLRLVFVTLIFAVNNYIDLLLVLHKLLNFITI